jgi:pyruvate/2-oxoglutarate dehydrogenase complex dihydrolipoamide acyltransferase (E2) component
MEKCIKRRGDRYDGKILKKIDPFYKIIPYIMKSRIDSQVYYEDKINLTNVQKFVTYIRKNKNIKVSFLHLVIAAMVRTISQKPRINRFVSGRKIYARNEITISFAIKKGMNENSPETTIKVQFKPTDTLFDVIEKINKEISINKETAEQNDTDKVAKIIMICPGFIIRIIIGLINFLDQHGKMPKYLNNVSPFHSSVFLTNLGSLGIKPIYHHIYEFGTTSLFIAFGNKYKVRIIDSEGKFKNTKYVDIKVVADERICDGFYYASAFKTFKELIENPERIAIEPQNVYLDNEI